MNHTDNKKANKDLLKLLFDPKRVLILKLASEAPVTVTQIAEQMHEKPSRLYYHVNKLVEADLLELVETKQQGNLLEKYYKTKKDQMHLYKMEGDFLKDHGSTVLMGLRKLIQPGLKIIEKSMEHEISQQASEGETKFPYHTKLTSIYQSMTAETWEQTMEKAKTILVNDNQMEQEWVSKLTPEEKKQKGTYAFLLMSYRVEDAEALGLIESESSEDEEK